MGTDISDLKLVSQRTSSRSFEFPRPVICWERFFVQQNFTGFRKALKKYEKQHGCRKAASKPQACSIVFRFHSRIRNPMLMRSSKKFIMQWFMTQAGHRFQFKMQPRAGTEG